MMNPKKLLFILMFLSGISKAQTVNVTKQAERIKGETANGYSTTIDASAEETLIALTRYMKTFGKAKINDATIVIAEPTVNRRLLPMPLYATAKGSTQQATAWIGYKATENDSATVESKMVADLVKTFGINFYRDKIQTQIEETQRAVDVVEKQQQRALTENKTLNQRMDNTTSEFQQLTKALQNNRLDSANLQKRLQQNKKSQDSLVLVLDKVRKALEFQKEKQRKVN
jgi:hypothetical protein